MQESNQTHVQCALTPIDPALLGAPIDYLHAVHLREREVCAILERMANLGHATAPVIDAIMPFLANELPAHLEDEETDLFPSLRKRCTADDEIDRLLDRLHRDHRHADFETPRVAEILEAANAGLDPADCDELRRYADHARRHLILENAVLLPFARLRLTGADLEALEAAMRRRRDSNHSSDLEHAE